MKTKKLTKEMFCGFKYSPQTGLLYKPNGSPVLSKDVEGYLRVKVKDVAYKAHRIAFVLMGHNIDGRQVDHINGNRRDNRWGNLRLVSNRENGRNRWTHRNGRLVGATKRAAHRWIAQGCKGGKQHYLGTFRTEKEAHDAYMRFTETEKNSL